MSANIWIRCGGRRNCKAYRGEAWRVIEGQHRISTRRLVDSDEEQGLLEALLETAKPPLPGGLDGLHYLLSTPFRHPPLRHGSRFGRRTERSIWYGSERLETAFAEAAYYRLVFLAGTTAAIEPIIVDLSAFRASLHTQEAVDLTEASFRDHEGDISNPTHYGASQALGTAMRGDAVDLAIYRSARDPDRGKNIAVFSPGCFAKKRPSVPETWLSVSTRQKVEFTRRDYFEKRNLVFPRETFEVDGELPSPAF